MQKRQRHPFPLLPIARRHAVYFQKTGVIRQMIYDNSLPKMFSPLLKLNDGMKEPIVLFRRLSDYMDENNRYPYYFTALSTKDLTPMFDIRPQFRQLPPECACPVDIIGLSNGVFCYCNNIEGYNFVLWNPSTDEYKVLPSPPFPRPSGGANGFLTEHPSFTFDINNLDCKVLQRVIHTCEDEDGYPVRVLDKYELYSLKKNIWKEMTPAGLRKELDRPVSVGGVSYFIAIRVARGNNDRIIGAFDFEAEEFYTLPFPETGKKLDDRYDPYDVHLLDYDGSLSIMVYSLQGGPENFELWVLTDGSWEKVFDVSLYFAMSRPFFVNKDVLFLKDKHNRILVFNLTTKELKNLGLGSDYERRPYLYVPNKLVFTQPLFSTCSK